MSYQHVRFSVRRAISGPHTFALAGADRVIYAAEPAPLATVDRQVSAPHLQTLGVDRDVTKLVAAALEEARPGDRSVTFLVTIEEIATEP